LRVATLFLMLITKTMSLDFAIQYNKPQVIQALRYHFITRREIKVLLIFVNVFAILAAIMFGLKKISPVAFLLSSLLWVMLMGGIWFLLPSSIYKRNSTFQHNFMIHFLQNVVRLETEKGETEWSYEKFSHYVESPNFFHLYFDARSFFLVPKESMDIPNMQALRAMLNEKMKKG
jgi:hypothetical protein